MQPIDLPETKKLLIDILDQYIKFSESYFTTKRVGIFDIPVPVTSGKKGSARADILKNFINKWDSTKGNTLDLIAQLTLQKEYKKGSTLREYLNPVMLTALGIKSNGTEVTAKANSLASRHDQLSAKEPIIIKRAQEEVLNEAVRPTVAIINQREKEEEVKAKQKAIEEKIKNKREEKASEIIDKDRGAFELKSPRKK